MHIHQISTTGFAIMAIFVSHFVHAEGSYQTGLNQPLEETSNSGAPLYVDVLNAGEVINVSLCGEANDNNVRVRIFDPANSPVLDTTLLSGNVTCDDPFTSELTNPVRYTTNTIGSYRIELDDTDGGNILNRFDISITPNASTNPDPTLANGRLWGYQWSFNAGTFTELGATDADYYALVPGGRPATHYVWKLDLNKFAGFAYDIVANDQGVDAPSSGYSVETNVNNVTPKFPIYLSYPVVANQRPTDPPLISDFRFIDSDGQDYAISPAVTHGIQDSGNFEFTTDVAGTYAITIDTNSDGNYGANDVLLLGTAVVGLNQVNWNGRDATMSLVANGTYHARLQLRLGEYHFIAHDAETSGGPSSDGLTIFLANSDGSTNDTLVYWDDATYLGGTTTLPDGALASTSAGRHTWGNFTGLGFGDKRYIDTYVYGLTSSQTTLTAITGSDALLTGTDGSINVPATGPTGSNIPITVTDADLNLLPGISESIIVQAVNSRSAEIEQVVLTETGLNTGIFSGSLSTTNNANTGTNNNGILNIVNDDAIDIDYQDQLDSNGLTAIRTTRYLASRDSDNDGIVDTLDLDSDNDGIPDNVEGDASIDSDADGTPDYLDRDSDGDGIDDIIEAGGNDTDNDGQVDGFTDTNNDGLDDTLAATPLPVTDSDGDGIPDYRDNRDSDGDGVVDSLDLDSDNDGIPDSIEGGISIDSDNDGIADYLDLDSDNDGLYDLTESGISDPASLDIDGNGRIDNSNTVGTNGLANIVENSVDSGNINYTVADTDTDGIADFRDLDSDSDGLFDVIEAGGNDPDNDGILGSGTPSVDGNGLATGAGLTLIDTDNDDIPNQRDLDADNDGTPDANDAFPIDNSEIADRDGDGIGNNADLDADNDGIPDSVEGDASIDSDADGTPDYLDRDSDNDGINDIIEAGGSDTDNDGQVDGFTDINNDGLDDTLAITPLPITDSNGDGIPDYRENYDSDGDGVVDSLDLDSDNDGIPDSVEGSASIDSDNDGIADYLDLDSDNDGLYDLTESGISDPASLDTDDDGRIDSSNTVGTNGLTDAVETSIDSGNINYTVADTDTDGIADFRDLDSDSDGLFDVIEAGGNDPDNDGILGSGTPSVDGNGLATGAGLTLIDTDNDDIPNQRDLDADNDGTPDANDAFPIDNSEIADRDGDGIGNNADLDADNDGIPDSVEGDANIDSDADGTPDYLDRDSDNDGIDDIIEAGGSDTDNDGQVDGFTDTNNDGLDDTLAITPLPITDSNGDGTPDYQDSADSDADGVVNSLDLDRDNDGIPNNAEGNASIDTDGDGITDHLDLDSDNDGIPDLIESGINDPAALDADNDGRIDANNPVGNNGLADAVETATDSGRADYNGDGTADAPRDSDNDNLPDYRDLDSDNDGINDIIEAGGTDSDEDGRLDGPVDGNDDGLDDSLVNNPLPDIHTDTDNDGIPDYRDNDDLDSDGIADIFDLDNDNDGIPDLIEGSNANVDTDNDGIPDYRDRDSDNDGLFDLTESGISNPAALDSDNNGRIDNNNAVGSNGLANAVETSTDSGSINYTVADTDNDGIDDYRDLDTDNDGIPDVTEAGGNDPDGDGVSGNGTPLVDNDGLVTGAGLSPGNSDNDDAPNYRDPDSDGDGINDIIEAGGDDIDSDGQVDDFTDTDNDGLDDTLAASPLPLPDSDGNGVPDYQDNADLDNDGISNTSDVDNDNDGIPDLIEGSSTDVDTDSDGIPDYRDLDSDNDGLFDLTESGIDTYAALDTDGNGRIDIGNAVGSNGLADTVETNTDSGTINYILTDSDDDGIDDYRDLDSDGDGIPDVIEGNRNDADNDGRIGSGTPSVDTNGIASGSGATALDSDNDGIPDYRDLDSDNDSITDVVEAGGTDNDGDGHQDATGDIDGNGFDDAVQTTPLPRVDTDGDGIPDYRDPATAARQPRAVRTGLDGLGGCTLNPGATFDPMLPLLLLIALLSLWRRNRCTKQQAPNQ